MSVIIDASQLVEIAEGRGIDCDEMISCTQDVAERLAKKAGIRVADVSSQLGFGGLCACFMAGEVTTCPEDFQLMDPEGEL